MVASGKNYKKEKHFHLDVDLIKKPEDNSLYDGWWQSESYFENVKSTIRKDFTFKDEILPVSYELYDKIATTNSICLNVRRTDFVSNPTLNATNATYFDKAVKYITNQVEEPHFFVFSDDMYWCEENLRFDHPVDFVHHQNKGRKFGNYLQLMKSCRHFIIPNSSFAWWAVWLSEHKNKIVIAPKNWFNDPTFNTSDLVPPDWLRL